MKYSHKNPINLHSLFCGWNNDIILLYIKCLHLLINLFGETVIPKLILII